MTVAPNFGNPSVVPQLVANWIHQTGTINDPDVTPVYLGEAISEVTVETQILGSALLQVTLIDPAWKIQRSGLIDKDSDGFLQKVDVNYPEGTPVWWRLAMVDFGNDLTSPNLTLTFQQRIVSYMLDCWGHFGATANLTTRAQFVKALVDKVPHELPKDDLGPGSSPIIFICPELNELQPIASSSGSSSQVVLPGQAASTAASVNKTPAVTAGSNLTVKGQPITATQVANANMLIATGKQLGAGTPALVAVIYAAMGETSLNGATTANSLGFIGLLQGSDKIYSGSAADDQREAHDFFMGGNGYQAGGAIALEKNGVSNPAEIAIRVEVPSIWPTDSYATEQGMGNGMAEATAIVAAGGGGGLAVGAGGSTAASAALTRDIAQLARGTADNPDEDTFTCIQRLTSDVNWRFFSSPHPAYGKTPNTDVWGNYVYYIDDPTLVAQKPSLYLELSADGSTFSATDPDSGQKVTGGGDGMITNLTGTIDNTQFAYQQTRKVKGKRQTRTRIRTPQTPSQARFNMVSSVMQFNAGDVFVFRSAGPLDGRWIVEDVTHNTLQDPYAQYTLGPPTYPYPEPQGTSTTASPVALGAGGTPVIKGGATNPAPGATWGRLDQGFDGDYGPQGVVAPYNGTIGGIGITGWPGQGAYFAILNADQSGPDYTRAMYFAEGATPIYPNGTRVTVGQKIGNPVAAGGTGAPGNFEIGPANTSTFAQLTASYGNGSPAARAMIMAFYAWMRSLGAGATNDPSAAGGP